VWILATLIVATGIITDFVKWDDLNRDFVSTNELSRAFLASVILVMDLIIVMQVGVNLHILLVIIATFCTIIEL
jgi:hypothetical protein